MSAVLETPTLRQREGLAAYCAARRAAIQSAERQAWHRNARPLLVHRTTRHPTRWQRLRATFAAEYGRAWPLAMLGALLYFLGGTLASVAVVACMGGWQP